MLITKGWKPHLCRIKCIIYPPGTTKVRARITDYLVYNFCNRAAKATGSFVLLRCTQDDRYRQKDRGKEEKWGGAAAPFFFSLFTPALLAPSQSPQHPVP